MFRGHHYRFGVRSIRVVSNYWLGHKGISQQGFVPDDRLRLRHDLLLLLRLRLLAVPVGLLGIIRVLCQNRVRRLFILVSGAVVDQPVDFGDPSFVLRHNAADRLVYSWLSCLITDQVHIVGGLNIQLRPNIGVFGWLFVFNWVDGSCLVL